MPDYRTNLPSRLLISTSLVAAAATCGSEQELAPFRSDGCSLFPDSSLIDQSDWCACCFEHDLAYWQGGTYAERQAADATLRSCVFNKTGNEVLAELMYQGVKLGGSAYFYTWYRWGYGWPYDRKYQALTSEEQAVAERLLMEYRLSGRDRVCSGR